MKLALMGALAGLWLASGASVMAEGTNGVVVELFTSQGCSSCPPADAYMRRLAEEPGVIALSLHVDYWDYIGWVDQFANPKFTDRQKAYARAEGKRTIYTPQIVVGGQERMVGSDEAAVAAAVLRQQAEAPDVALTLKRSAGGLEIAAEPLPMAPAAPIRVQLVRFTPHAQVAIDAGENAGLMVDYINVVTSWQPLADWDGTSPLRLQAEIPGADGVVVILQDTGPGRVRAAQRLD